MEQILHHFPDLTEIQINQFKQLKALYIDWNSKINVISRKDIDELYTRHVLHSLGIAKIMAFKPNSEVLDVGTGGGFPGIPLAILYPQTSFHLIDVIAKKIKVVNEVKSALNLNNVFAEQKRAGTFNKEYDFIVSRAVTNMPDFVKWVKSNIKSNSRHDFKNGILYLKGGDLTEELKSFPSVKIFNLSDYFEDLFFETKKVVYLKL